MYQGIFLLSMSLLIFELTLIRVYSAILFYHFAFMAISVAMLGLAAGALTVHFYPHKFTRENAETWSGRWSTAFGISIFISLWIVFRIPVNAYLSPDMIAGKLIAIYFLSAVPFYFAGIVITALFSSYPEHAGTLYAWDLIGAGVGAVIILPLINIAGGETVGLVVAALALLSSAFLTGGRRKAILVMFIAALLMIGSNSKIGWLKILYSKGQSLKSLDVRYNRWNSFSRIMVIPFRPGTEAVYTWCPSPNYPLPVMEHMSLMIDDGAATPVLPFDGKDLKPIEYLKYDLTSLCHRLKGDGNTLVIGSGGGRDVLTALMFDAQKVDAVDINPLIFEAMNGPIAEFSGSLYRHPKVQYHIAEGRAFARRHPETYDLIQIAMIDTWAATTAGAYSLSENTLYTVEAFRDYMHALKPDGIFSFTRFFLRPPRQALRLTSLFLEAAKQEGIDHPEQCIMVAMYESLATLVFKNEPFTADEIKKFTDDVADLGFFIVYTPAERPDPFFNALIGMPDKEVFYRKYTYNMRPSTDDQPFFFNMLKMKDFMKVFDLREGQKFNYYATYTLIVILIFSLISTLITLVLPSIIKAESLPVFQQNWKLLLYFIGIGLAYIMIEVSLLQRFILFLEHPAYSASGVVACLLISSGLGSMFWGRISGVMRKRVFSLAFVVIGIGLLFQIILGSTLIHMVIHLPLVVKVLFVVLMIIPLGVVMGIPLPAGITFAGKSGSGTVAWCWALNGSASVVASSLAVTIAMSKGFIMVLIVSAFCYLAAYLFMISNSKPDKFA